jgi:glycosyltransferase involved in cell wall biosynthesis
MKPKISVIVPIYNVEKYLRQCLDSIVAQTLVAIEVICINDGSPDNCEQIANDYSKSDTRIKLITKENGGYGSACNAGLKIAAGEYIAIVEPDDYIERDMYEKLYDLANTNDVDIVKSCFYFAYDIGDYKNIRKIRWSKKFKLPSEIFNIREHPEFLCFHPSIWTCIYKKEFLDKYKIRFMEAKGASWTDNPFQVQTMCLARSIFYTNEAFYYWRRVNLIESDDLKDYAIPFKRNNEIHDWLGRNNDIVNEDMLACLYKRELGYIKIVFGMLSANDLKYALVQIKTTLERMSKSILFSSKFVKASERILFIMLKIAPLLIYLKVRARILKKKIKFFCVRKIFRLGTMNSGNR